MRERKTVEMFAFELFVVILMLIAYPLMVESVPPANSISMKIVNNAGAALEVYWIDTISGSRELVRQTSKPLRNGTDANINSYNSHQFVARFSKHLEGVEAFFTKGPSEESVVITYDRETKQLKAKQITKFHEIMDLIDAATVTCNEHAAGDEFSNCITGQVMQDIDRLTNTKQEMMKYRDVMAPSLRDYVCADPKVNISEKIHSDSATVDKRRYVADVYLDTPESKIWVVNGAITKRECDAISNGAVDAASAVVTGADGVGTTVAVDGGVSKKHYNVDVEYPDEEAAWPVFARALTITSQVTKLSLDAKGQDPLEIVSLEEGAEEGVQCSGTCDGTAYKPGSRVASAILFCEVPTSGGLVHFPKSDVILKPNFGSGVFYSYKNAESDHMDDGYVEHSICPITAGTQTSVRVHMRLYTPTAASTAAAAAAAGR